jgi:hypothetical protein
METYYNMFDRKFYPCDLQEKTKATSDHEKIITKRQQITNALIPASFVESRLLVKDYMDLMDLNTTTFEESLLMESLNIPFSRKFKILPLNLAKSKIPEILFNIYSQQSDSRTAVLSKGRPYESTLIRECTEYAYVSVIDELGREEDGKLYIKKELDIKCLVLRKGLFPTGYQYYVDYPMTNLYMWAKHRNKEKEFSESILEYVNENTDDYEVVLRCEDILKSHLKYVITILKNKKKN